jgi:hypothetical protein
LQKKVIIKVSLAIKSALSNKVTKKKRLQILVLTDDLLVGIEVVDGGKAPLSVQTRHDENNSRDV